jgi:hypothetical protein
LIFKHLYPVTKHKKKRHHQKKDNVSEKDVDVQQEETETVFKDQKANHARKVLSKDVDNQNRNTVIDLENEKTKHQAKVNRKDNEIKSDAPKTFDEVQVELNAEHNNDQKQEAIVKEDTGNTNVDPRTKNERVVDTDAKEEKHAHKNTTDTKEPQLGPIIGYADEPLLPLSEACIPLIGIVDDVLSYAKRAVERTPATPPDGLTIDESAAIRLYTMQWAGPRRSLYSMINRTLKYSDREELRPYFKYMKLFLTALIKIPCAPPLTVWRGVTKDLSAQFPPGSSVTWWAFSSCTTEMTVLEDNVYLGDSGNRTLFSVEAINGRTVRDHSDFVTEDEMLLLPGTHMTVQSQMIPAPDLHIVHLKQVIPEEILLEPPFEGIFNTFYLVIFNHNDFLFRCRSLSKD